MKAKGTRASQDLSATARLRDMLRRLYHGRSPAAFRFQLVAVIIDLAIIAFFIATPVIQQSASFLWLDYAVAALVAADLIARLLASNDMLSLMKQPTFWVNAFILLTLLMPAALASLGFCEFCGCGRCRAAVRPGGISRCVACDPGARQATRSSTC